jgi:hypothetical protein
MRKSVIEARCFHDEEAAYAGLKLAYGRKARLPALRRG